MIDAVDIAAAVNAGTTTAVDAVRAALARIEAVDPAIGAFLDVDADGALARAVAVDGQVKGGARLPLAGVPVALKDNLCTATGLTTCGSQMLRSYRPPYAAHVVEQLIAAGAVIVGKTNLDEFAMGSSTENSSIQPTCNPWNHGRVPGGSSGGSAAAVAAGMVPVALGSDTGGSIRQPAAFCGVVGLKPTYGRVSRYGLVAFGSSLDQIGPLTRTAEDAALVLSVIAGHDERDATCLDQPPEDYRAALARPLAGLRIGIAAEHFGAGLAADCKAAIDAGLAALREAGADIVEVSLPHEKYGVAAYYIICTAEASSNLARFDGVHYGHRSGDAADILALASRSRAEALGAEVKRRIMLGTYALSSGYYDAYYLRASKLRTLLRRDYEAAFAQVDFLCTPVAPSTAFALGEKTDDPLAMYLADIYTVMANLTGLPALSVPCGFDAHGLPVGMQLVGPALAEARLLAAAHQFQLITDHHRREPMLTGGA